MGLLQPQIAGENQADIIQVFKYVLFIAQTVWQFFANMLTQECTYINSKRNKMDKGCKEVCDFFML